MKILFHLFQFDCQFRMCHFFSLFFLSLFLLFFFLVCSSFSFTLYLRLFIVMGVTWIMEVISFFISRDAMAFIVTDICNSVQGVVIFALFVLKRRVFKLIKNRFVDLISLLRCGRNDVDLIKLLISDLLFYVLFSVLKFRWKQITGKTITNGSSATNSISVTRTSNLRLNHIGRNDTIPNH